MRRKIVLILTALVVCVLVALAALPWWWGAALGLSGKRFGLTFREYQRSGYTRFVLKDVTVRRPGVEVKASRVELATPLAWLVGHPGPVAVDHWSVAVTKTDTPPDPTKPKGWLPLRALLDRVIDQLERRLPPSTAGAGEISWPGGGLHLANAEWRDRELHVAGLTWRDQSADVTIKREPADRRLWAQALFTGTANEGGEVTLESAGDRLIAHARWWGQPLSADARFAATGWIPTEATVQAADWQLPAARAGLADFYETVLGGVNLAWREGHFSVDAHAEGKPLAAGKAPPLQVRFHGSGGLDQLSLDQFDVQVPGVRGHLNEPVVVGRDGRLISGPSRFDLAVDLAKQPWFTGSGRVTGVVQITPREGGGVPRVSATLSTSDAAVADWVATQGKVEATLEWPRLHVAAVTLKLADGDDLIAGGDWDFHTHTLASGRAQGRVSRTTVARWLARTTASFEQLEFDGTAAGTWPQIAHEGHAKALGLLVPPLRPLAVNAEWKGTGRTLDSIMVNAVAGGTRVQARGALAEASARIDELVLTQADEERLHLVAPVNVQWKPALVVDAFQLNGPGGSELARDGSTESRASSLPREISGQLAWGAAGAVKLDVRAFDSAWLGELVELPGPTWSVDTLALQGSWAEGAPLTFTTNATGVLTLAGGRHAELALSAQGDGRGVRVETLRASMNQRVVARAAGNLPVAIFPGQKPLLRIDESAGFSLEAATEPNAFFWEQLAALTGLVITEPEVRVSLTGTVRKPLGEATVRVVKVTSDGTGQLRALPAIENVDVRLTATREGVALETFSLKAAGQLVRASGRLPVTEWAALLHDPLSLAKASGEARIEIPNADVAALARYAPAILAPTGTLQVDVALKPGGQLHGVIRLRDAATRPIGPLGILQSVGAEIVLAGRTVELKEVRASMGGQPVTLSGTVALPDSKEPRLDLALRGEKLPFIRQAGLLVRGDLDLRIVTGDDDITRITGATRLRDSLFLMDVRALLPTGGPKSAPGRRPPYFTVDVPPFDDWQLDVTVDGDQFLRMRTPVFAGLASAHFRLRGTLRDPRATGEAVVNQGQVLLPFATFAVKQGGVRLTEANPFEPTISLIGTSRRYGYDLRMEVTGSVEKPQLTFFSTPTLESEQVLLMVMAGETPQKEVTYSGRERATRLGTYLGQSLLGQLGGDPTEAERLTVTVGERISDQGRETYGVEYELSPRWSVVGEYDEFDAYNLGLKWHVLMEKKKQEASGDAQKK